MSCFCKVELRRHFLYCPSGTGPLGSMLPNEIHFTEEQKLQTLAVMFAVISHVYVLYILDDHTGSCSRSVTYYNVSSDSVSEQTY